MKDEANIDSVRELLVEQATLSRAEPGCARFEVYHSREDRSLFLLVDQWESQENLDVHRQAKSCVEVYVPKVLPLVDRVPHPCDRVL